MSYKTLRLEAQHESTRINFHSRHHNANSGSSRKNFWHRCQGDLRQVKTYQVPIINSHLLHYIICHSPIVFLSPTSKTIFEKICPFLCPSSIRLLVCPYILLGLFAPLLGIIVCLLKIRNKVYGSTSSFLLGSSLIHMCSC